MKKNILSVLFIFVISTSGTAQEQIVEAISFGGEELYHRTVSEENQTKYTKLIKALAAKKEKTEDDYLTLGGYHISLNAFNNAIAVYSEGLEKYPNSFKMLRHRGHRYMNIRKLDLALIDLNKARTFINSETSKEIEYYADGSVKGTYEHWIYYHIALYHYLNANYDEAIAGYKKCLTTSVTNANMFGATDWLYNSYLKNGQPEKAVALLKNPSITYNANSKSAYHKRLMLYKGVLEPKDLLDPEKTAEEWTAGDTTSAYAIGTFYQSKGETAKAQKYHEGILKTPYWNIWAYVTADRELSRTASNDLYDYDVEEKLKELGIELSEPREPKAFKISLAVKSGNLLYLSGNLPFSKNERYQGKPGKDLTIEEGYKAARLVGINHLSTLKAYVGDLNKVEKIVKVLGLVNSEPDFKDHSKVINGFSDLMYEVFGERGLHARSAVGLASIPFNGACEIEMIVQIKE